MRKAVLILLVLSAVLVAETEARWFRRAFNSVKNTVTKAANTVASKVKSWVEQHKANLRRIAEAIKNGRKKRSAGSADADEIMTNLIAELELSCPSFGLSAGDTIDEKLEDDAFDAADDNNDGCLNKEELTMYNDIIDTMEECIELENEKKK
ncbi:uncharacterized protein [Littorina saxatilis]|uniref:EF-hand domain-containing protein n=1 Tax=Littorina saxatilis TaxID=31220 RepID=A0AAN9G9E6_9CAEN